MREVCILIIVIVPILQKTLQEQRSDPPRSKRLQEAEAELTPGSLTPSCTSVVPLNSLQHLPGTQCPGLGAGDGEGVPAPLALTLAAWLLLAPHPPNSPPGDRLERNKAPAAARTVAGECRVQQKRALGEHASDGADEGVSGAEDKRIEGQKQVRAGSLVAYFTACFSFSGGVAWVVCPRLSQGHP